MTADDETRAVFDLDAQRSGGFDATVANHGARLARLPFATVSGDERILVGLQPAGLVESR